MQRFSKGGALCRPPWLAGEKNFRFRCSKKAEITLETTSFWQNISIAYGALLMIYMHLLMNYAVCSSSKGWGGGGGWGAPTAPPPESASDVNYVTNKTCTVTNTIFWGFFFGKDISCFIFLKRLFGGKLDFEVD